MTPGQQVAFTMAVAILAMAFGIAVGYTAAVDQQKRELMRKVERHLDRLEGR